MIKYFFLFFIFSLFGFSTFSQCETLEFIELGSVPAFCRTAVYQCGNGVVYGAATGGNPDYTYQWTNLQTGATTINTTWGGLNPGDYQIKVTDSLGCMISAIVKLDSVIPIADFTISSIDLDSNFSGFNSAEVTVVNISENWGLCWQCATYEFPYEDTLLTMSVDGSAWEIIHQDEQEQTIIFDQAGYHEICVSATNKNHCTDTLCKTVTIVMPVESGPIVNITSSSISGDFFIELLIDYSVVLNVYDFSGTPFSSQNVVPGFNTFNFISGQYIYEIVDPITNQIIVSGTFFVL